LLLPLRLPFLRHPRNSSRSKRSLNTLGFFTPAKHKGDKVREKVVLVRRELNGKTFEAQATILPSAKYGLPTTADLDKYLAFHKLLEQVRNRVGEITNPVGFTSTHLLTVLGIKDAGNNYQDIHDWLQRMTLTGINSKGMVYMARRRTWVSDTFHVFDRVVTMGSMLPDGAVADQNYVWLSDWQLENINSNYLLPIDLETYRKLRNQIAKILVPLLQVWLYASRAEGRFEKRYAELCEILDVVRQKHLSLIRRQLDPSLAELTYHGYLASWAIQPTVDGREYKLVAVHGHKFYRDQRIRTSVPAAAQIEGDGASLLKELTNRTLPATEAQTPSKIALMKLAKCRAMVLLLSCPPNTVLPIAEAPMCSQTTSWSFQLPENVTVHVGYAGLDATDCFHQKTPQ
jgi:hypothetical protein